MTKVCLKMGILVLVMLVCGCLPWTSLNPLGDRKDAIRDPAITGLWYTVQENSSDTSEFYVIIAQDGEGDIKIRFTQKEGPNTAMTCNADTEYYRAYITEVNKEKYLNIYYDARESIRGKEYFFAHYSVSKKGELKITLLSHDPFEKAMEAGVLKGEPPKKKDQGILLKDTSENIVKFIKNCKLQDILEKEPVIHAYKMKKPPVKYTKKKAIKKNNQK